jgi:hypothetical protein
MGNIISKIIKFTNKPDFKYSVSLKNQTFPVDYIAIDNQIPLIKKAIESKKDMTVWVSTKVYLLQQLQFNGALEMDIIGLVENYTVKNIDKITDLCLKDSKRKILKTQSGAYILEDFQLEQ